MSQLTSIADSVESWRGLGVEFTPELDRAIKTLDRVRWAEVGRPARFDLADLTDDVDPEEFIEAYARNLALVSPPGALGPLDTAKQEIVDAAARAVIGQARAIIPAGVASLQPKLLETAERYAEQVALLPAELSAESLVRAGSKAVDAFNAAAGLAQQLGQLDNFVTATGNVQGIAPKQWASAATRLLAPGPGQVGKLDAAGQLPTKRGDVVPQIGRVYYEAIKLGVEWRLHSMREAIALQRQLSTPQPVSFSR